MNKIIIYSLILLFLYLIIQHFLTTKEGLESNCTTSSDASDGNSDGGCKRVATQQNSQAAQFTKRKMASAKKTITDLMNKVSKLIQTEKKQVNKNTKGIETNLTNVDKMKQAITPDK
tara:strand:+ start:154 stop:504 length:351 start_codon:yes stop_codon:yes gene_type:complete